MQEEERKIHPAVVIGIGLGLVGAAAAVAYALTRPKAPPTPPPGLANLYGVVIDAESEKGLADVLVTLDDIYTYTDKDGYYTFTDLEPRDYSVMFSKEEYKTVVIQKTVKEGNNELNAALWPYMLAELVLDGLRVTWTGAYEDRIVVGDTVHIWARARNTGTEPGSWQITWRVGGKIQTELLELEGKQIKQIAFTYFVPESPGVYPIEVDGLTGSFEVVEELIEPVATITSIELDKTTARQGEDITAHAHIQSNFAGTAWIVFAYGRGTPSPGAGFRPLYNVQGDYLGWFPSGFDFVRFDPYTTGVNVGGMDLKVGDNSVSHTFGLRRNLPLGEYTIYVGVVPPAANWYQWDEPYDWAVSESFTVLEEGPRLVVVEPIISQYLHGNIWLPGTFLKHAVDIGAFSLNRNWLCSQESDLQFLFREPPEPAGWPRDYYMEFLNPTTIIIDTISTSDETRYPDLRFSRLTVNYLAIGIMVKSDPPEDIHSIPTKYYTLEITGWLTYPDGHTEQKSTIDKTPRAEFGIFREWNFHRVPFAEDYGSYYRGNEIWDGGIDQPMALGEYTIRLKLVCEGITFVDETKSFTIVE